VLLYSAATGAVDAPSFTVSSQNCNSLNLSGTSSNLDAKLEAITAIKTDIIFLSDIRLTNARGVQGSERIRKYLRDNRNRAYEFYHNSTSNGRGVAILIAMEINTVVNREWRDQAENVLIMDVSLNGCNVTLGSIYGPNNTGREFYRFIYGVLGETAGSFTVIGGDWNTVLDPQPVQYNIDIINMAAIPNAVNSGLLREMCNHHNLSDPFRVLYPNKKDYTYSPFSDIRRNRSRLDFFLISNNLIPSVDHCLISPSVLCVQFDHKNISLSLNYKTDLVPKKKKLTNCFLNSRYLGLSVTASAIESYAAAIDTSYNENPTLPANFASTLEYVEDLKRQISSLKTTLCELENLELQKAKNDEDAYLDMLVSAKIATASLAIENMSSILSLNKKTRFFEVLVEQTKKSGMNAQKKLAYHEKIRKETLKKQIETLKANYAENHDKIFELERTLGRIVDSEIKSKLLEIKSFECLHAEKATEHFLDIAKKTAKTSTLSDIKDVNGTDFDTDLDRNAYITNFYSSLYRKDETVEGEIEDFLGPEICAHPVVSGSKLTEAERTSLDSPLRIEELDVALNKANIRSAPGIDGFSYRFIIRFWDIYRRALFECACESFELGVMPDAFRTASIRLIPKKGTYRK
jgi:exonuclease III